MKSTFLKGLFVLAFVMPLSLSAQTGAKKTTTAKKATTKTSTKTAAPAAKKAEPALIMPVMTFTKKTTDFGKVKTGDMPTYTYEFTNTGNAPLDIEICTGCECTEIDWTRTTVKPGEKGFVKAVFNTKKAEPEDHKKQLKKYIDIILKQAHPKTSYPLVESLQFDVFITD